MRGIETRGKDYRGGKREKQYERGIEARGKDYRGGKNNKREKEMIIMSNKIEFKKGTDDGKKEDKRRNH